MPLQKRPLRLLLIFSLDNTAKRATKAADSLLTTIKSLRANLGEAPNKKIQIVSGALSKELTKTTQETAQARRDIQKT